MRTAAHPHTAPEKKPWRRRRLILKRTKTVAKLQEHIQKKYYPELAPVRDPPKFAL